MPLANDVPGQEISATARQAFGPRRCPPGERGRIWRALSFMSSSTSSCRRAHRHVRPVRPDRSAVVLRPLARGSAPGRCPAAGNVRPSRRYRLLAVIPAPGDGYAALEAAERFARWRTATADTINTLTGSGARPRWARGSSKACAPPKTWLDEPVPPSAADAARQWVANGGRHGMPGGMLDRPMGRQENLTDPADGRIGSRLVRDLGRLGVQPGQTLLVHASVRSIGLGIGGPSVVVRALRKAVGPTGNIVVPTGTAENSVTSRAHRRPLIAQMTDDEVAAYGRTMPGFDKDVTPSTTGALGEALRTAPRAVRSAHPQSSFAAMGPRTSWPTIAWNLTLANSPLAKVYGMEASGAVLRGGGYQVCSAFHLAECRLLRCIHARSLENGQGSGSTTKTWC